MSSFRPPTTPRSPLKVIFFSRSVLYFLRSGILEMLYKLPEPFLDLFFLFYFSIEISVIISKQTVEKILF